MGKFKMERYRGLVNKNPRLNKSSNPNFFVGYYILQSRNKKKIQKTLLKLKQNSHNPDGLA